MSIENLQEIQEYFTTNGENEEVQGYLNSFKQEPTLDIFKSKIESDEDFKSYLNSQKDSHFSKSLETWKQNNLQKLIDAEMLKKNPSLTPEQLRIQELEQKFSDMEKAKTRAEQLSKYKDVLTEKKIPSKMVDFLLSDDEEVTNANITLFEESMKSYIEEAIKVKFDSNVHIPQTSKTEVKNELTDEMVNKMSQEELVKYLSNH